MNDIKDLVVAALIAAVIFAPVACTMHDNTLIADLIKNGTPPLGALCAISPRESVCEKI